VDNKQNTIVDYPTTLKLCCYTTMWNKFQKIIKITNTSAKKLHFETIFSINFHIKIKLRLVLHTFLMFVNKSRRYYSK